MARQPAASNLNLNASGGAQFVLPALTQITESAYNSFQSSGAGSLLNLSQVTAINGSNQVTMQTGSGGEINLPNLNSIASGENVLLNASGGTLNLPNVGGGTSNGGVSNVQLSNSGTVLWGSPTSLSNFSLTMTGTGNTIDISHVAAATNLNLNASSGARVVFPLLTQIAENNYNSFQSSGAGSLLNLSQVTAINGSNQVTMQTGSGGEINLPNLNSIASGENVLLNASGGTLNLPNVGGGTSNGGVSNVQLSNSGTVLWGSPTSLSNFSLTMTGTGNTIDISHVATATNLNLNASSGAQVVFPLLTQIAENNYNSFQSSGVGSLLNLSQVTAINGSNQVTMQTSSGGEINLPNLNSIASGENVLLNASGGTLNLPNVEGGTSNGGVSNVQLSDSGTVLWSSPTSLSNFSLTMTGTGNTIDISHVAAATNLNLNASGGAQFVLPALTQITESTYNSFQSSGADSLLNLSQVTAINGSNQVTMQTGSGGEINLPNLNSIASGENVLLNASGGTINLPNVGGGTSNGGVSNVQLSNSGTVLWGSPTSLSNFSLTMTGTGNTIDISHVAAATNLNLNAASGAQVVFPLLTQIAENNYNSFQSSGAGSLLNLSQVTAINGSTGLNVQASSGGEVNLHNVVSIASSNGQSLSLNASAGTIDVSNLSPGPSNIQVQSGGSVLIGSLNLHNSTLTLSGANSTLTDEGNLSADSTSELNLGNGTTLLLGGSFSNGITNETNFTVSSATVQVIGPGQHTLEVAGLDLARRQPGQQRQFRFRQPYPGPVQLARHAGTRRSDQQRKPGERPGSIVPLWQRRRQRAVALGRLDTRAQPPGRL